MKVLTDRHEIAMAMNFRKYPVLSIDLAKADEFGLKGCKVRIDAGSFRDGLPFTVEAELRVYSDQKKLTTSSWGVCLSDSFSYWDYTEMVENANAPLIGPDQDVVIAIFNSKTKLAYPPMIVRTGDHVNPHCQTPLTFEPTDMSHYQMMAGIYDREYLMQAAGLYG